MKPIRMTGILAVLLTGNMAWAQELSLIHI